MPKRTEPNFLLGGTSAGGTSFLSAILLQHSQIYLPKNMRPEPHFFFKSWEYAKGYEYYLDSWFGHVHDHAIAVGERSSSYLYGGRNVAELITRHLPAIRMIFVLRDPIERAWANYRYTVLQGLEELTFEEALENESERVASAFGIWSEIQPHDYTGRGYYGRQLQDFTRYVSLSDMFVTCSEDLRNETDKTLDLLTDFLGLNEPFTDIQRPVDYTSVNVVDPKIQKQAREYLDSKFDLIVEAIRDKSDPYRFAESEKDELWISSLISNLEEEKKEIPKGALSLLQGRFDKDLELLKEFVDFDVSRWARNAR
tara:strand:- start:876 stop:1811 length:936 start_codon:yes stop_codon:yes gene_type:complete